MGAAPCAFWTEAGQSRSPAPGMWDTSWDPEEEHTGTVEDLLWDGKTQRFQRQEKGCI